MDGTPDEASECVEVWRFRRFDVRAGQVVTSIGKAAMDTIERYGAEPIPGSMESVPRHRLDGNGIYSPPTVEISAAARRRLERLKAQYVSMIDDEDHGRLEGWSARVEALFSIVKQIDDSLGSGMDGIRP